MTARLLVPLAADTMAGNGDGRCTTNCFDAYQAPITTPGQTSSGGWVSRSVPFAALRQQTFGPPEPWDPTSVISFQWGLTTTVETVTGEPFFLCVDQVTLF